MKHLTYALITCLLMLSCDNQPEQVKNPEQNNEILLLQLNELNQQITQATLSDNFNQLENLYLDSSILIADYQPLLDGKEKIAAFYEETYKRQSLVNYTRETVELFDFEKYALEIGLFEKTFTNGEVVKGKYFTNWLIGADEKLYIRAESFGFIGEPSNRENYHIVSLTDDSTPLLGRNGRVMPKEIELYNAFGENLVRDRNTQGVIDSYTEDGIYFPFADTDKTGRAELTKHFKAYHKNPVKIDSIEVWTYDFDSVNDGLIRYNKFFVIWTLPNGYTGQSSGAGIAYWKRNAQNILQIHRQIGTHILEP